MLKTVVIAGAGDRLGNDLVGRFLDLGWQVFAGYLPEEARRDATERLQCFGIDPLSHFFTLAARKKANQPIDMLIVNIDGTFGNPEATILDEQDYDALIEAYDYNALGPLRIINTFLPLLEQGQGKRICLITTQASSNNICQDTANFAEHLSKAALNMAMTQLFNGLRPDGYTFRMYCKDTEQGRNEWAVDYFIRDRSYEPEDLRHSDEERIVLRDHMGRELPW